MNCLQYPCKGCENNTTGCDWPGAELFSRMGSQEWHPEGGIYPRVSLAGASHAQPWVKSCPGKNMQQVQRGRTRAIALDKAKR